MPSALMQLSITDSFCSIAETRITDGVGAAEDVDEVVGVGAAVVAGGL